MQYLFVFNSKKFFLFVLYVCSVERVNMKINPISFGAWHLVAENKNKGVQKQDVKNEFKMARMAREAGVEVPEYEITAFHYEIKGKKANLNTNPITTNHLANVFKNLYLMDKNGISHNDLDIEHIFYGEDGNVEIDCFRFADKFKKGQMNLPDFMAPTNQINYEAASLSAYISDFYNDNDSRNMFLAEYLKESSKFHKKRSEYIADDLIKNADNTKFTLGMLDYEVLCADKLQEPDFWTLFLFIQKLDFLGKQRRAFTEWDEGNGACGHEFNPERREESIPMYLDAVESAIVYSKMAENMSNDAQGRDSLYFEYEAKVGEYFANTYLSWIRGMANWNFEDEKMQNDVDEEKRVELDEKFKKIIDAPLDEKSDLIKDYVASYKELISH